MSVLLVGAVLAILVGSIIFTASSSNTVRALLVVAYVVMYIAVPILLYLLHS